MPIAQVNHVSQPLQLHKKAPQHNQMEHSPLLSISDIAEGLKRPNPPQQQPTHPAAVWKE